MTDSNGPPVVVGVETPIINSPFTEPTKHWKIEIGEQPVTRDGRRHASYFYRTPETKIARRKKHSQPELFKSKKGQEVPLEIVNEIRNRVKEWREGTRTKGVAYDGASIITRSLLELWRSEHRLQQLFFAQIEAAETIIFLTEASKIYTNGMIKIPKDEPGRIGVSKGSRSFLRYACKMATGTGKTTVMGMLAAWSIINSVASRNDKRFSDTVLIVCPNVTIRERLKELDPAIGDRSIYRTRQLVPLKYMGHLRCGEVMIANWHRLTRKEVNKVNGESGKVVKTGELTTIVKNAGKGNESVVELRLESKGKWFHRIRREVGNNRGRCPNWLIFNDEAHHAYRRGDIELSLEEDKHIARKNAREATIWVEALDRINSMAGGRNRVGINLCVDLSATPFFIQGTGHEVGKPFPWIVSDFSLLDAIESGLVKVPQLPAQDDRGDDEAAYFNIWRWVESKLVEDGHGEKLTPETLLRHASAPINLLADYWKKEFKDWKDCEKDVRNSVPPVFIVVCKDTTIAKEVHDWLANGNDKYGDQPKLFSNKPGNEVTVRIDSKVIEDIEEGGTKDETKRLRFILDTVGKPKWPGEKIPEEWSELVRKHNEKVSNSSGDNTMKWIDEKIPPGKDVRCIVSVAMLTEGWDANNVTHIVGLRPFHSQLLCEQVVGRAIRRRRYIINEETNMFDEESATVFGVPFEIVPFKVSPTRPQPDQPERHHIFAVAEKERFKITFPVVTGYYTTSRFEVSVAWERVAKITIDPSRTPKNVTTEALTSPDGFHAGTNPGKNIVLSLDDWRRQFRDQHVAFRLANEVCKEWRKDNGAISVPVQVLFPKVVFAAKRFLAEKLNLVGDSKPCDILLSGDYMLAGISSLLEAIKMGSVDEPTEFAVIPRGQVGCGSTSDVEFYTPKMTYPAEKCHLNLMVADTKNWEQRAAFILDKHPGVEKWVKNDRLDFKIPYKYKQNRHWHIPDFIAVTNSGMNLVIEIKGKVTDRDEAKFSGGKRWADAVNNLGSHGNWRYIPVFEPGDLESELDAVCKKVKSS